jgi:cell division protein FtsB
MRKVVLGLRAAGSALAVAAPASAQYYQRPAPYGYGNGYGYNNFGQVRALQVRIDAVERQIRFLDRRNVVRDDRADRLREEANRIEDRLHRAARNGLNPREADEINVRIARLEQRVQYAVGNRGYGRYGSNGYNGYNGQYVDRDRDGRDDRYEDDHGWRPDR